MKTARILISFCVVLLSTEANAQSSLTLYGIADTGLIYNSNVGGGKLYGSSSGNMQGDRWGLRGAEDLGSGWQSIFVLENGFNLSTGRLNQGGDEFGRQAYVGISSSKYGSVTLGRQYDSVVDYTGTLEAASVWATALGAHPGDLDNLNNSNRTNNAVKYSSVTVGGWKFGALYSFGGSAGNFSQKQVWSLGTAYQHGALSLATAYLNVRNPNFATFGNNATSSTSGNNMTGSQVYSGYASAHTQQVVVAGGKYRFGKAVVGMMYSNTQFQGIAADSAVDAAASSGSRTAKFHNAEVNLQYMAAPDLSFGVAYDFTKGYSAAHETIHQVMAGADYFFSKRTDVYANLIVQHASGHNSLGEDATAQIASLSASSSQNQSVVVVGIRHKF